MNPIYRDLTFLVLLPCALLWAGLLIFIFENLSNLIRNLQAQVRYLTRRRSRAPDAEAISDCGHLFKHPNCDGCQGADLPPT